MGIGSMEQTPRVGLQLAKSGPNPYEKWHHHQPNHNQKCFTIMQSSLYGCHKRQTTLHWEWMGVNGDWEHGMGAQGGLAVGKIRPKSREKWHRHQPNHNQKCFTIMQSSLYGCHKRQTTLHCEWMGVNGDWEHAMGMLGG